MIAFLTGFPNCLSAFLRSRSSLALEILALRQQLGVLKRRQPRPRLQIQDRMFWILLRRLWPAWRRVLVIVKPETVVAWHRAGFRLFWRFRSRTKTTGRPKLNAEARAMIRRMAFENSSYVKRPVMLSREMLAWICLHSAAIHFTYFFSVAHAS